MAFTEEQDCRLYSPRRYEGKEAEILRAIEQNFHIKDLKDAILKEGFDFKKLR